MRFSNTIVSIIESFEDLANCFLRLESFSALHLTDKVKAALESIGTGCIEFLQCIAEFLNNYSTCKYPGGR